MKFHRQALLAFTALACLPGAANAGKKDTDDASRAHNTMGQGRTKAKPEVQRVIVTYKNGSKQGAMAAIQSANSHRLSGEPKVMINYNFDEKNVVILSGTKDEIANIEKSPDVEKVEEDPIRELFAPKNNLRRSRRLSQSIPYGIELVEAPELWAKGYTGQNVTVCVIDSGVDGDHPDFVSSSLEGSGVEDGYVDGLKDGCGHGTHVSGTVAARDNPVGVVGVAPDAKIVSVRVFGDDCGFTFGSEIYQAAQICKDNEADVINMSLGGVLPTELEENAFEEMFNDGILLVAAAGNDGDTSKNYPASYPSVISVGAVDSNKDLTFFSQRNSQIDVVAPGLDVLSTLPVGGCAICSSDVDGFGLLDGTSMASPHVAGALALLKSASPSSSSEDLRLAIEASAEDLGTSGRDNSYGYGLIRTVAALDCLENGPCEREESMCEDDPQGWHDSDGPTYDCDWYSGGTRCKDFGDEFENDGKTANEACCACGGGRNSSGPPTSTPAPTAPVSECQDSPQGWYDSAKDNCEWYAAEEGRCEEHGNDWENDGKTANEVCCVCGGGTRN